MNRFVLFDPLVSAELGDHVHVSAKDKQKVVPLK